MSTRVRPRFKLYIQRSQEDLESSFKEKLSAEGKSYEGRVLNGYIVIRVLPEEQHFWSPQLSISIREEEEGTEVRGLYGPHPSIWLGFTFVHIAVSVASLFILIVGLSNMSLGLSSMILWSLPVLAGISLVMYLIARAGQKLGEVQLYDLHHFFEEHLGQKILID
jgi:hypothetical protein